MAKKTTAERSTSDVDVYIARAPKAARTMLVKMRGVIRASVPRDATEVISYRMPAFRRVD